MSALRRVTTSLGLLERPPPDAVLHDRAPRVLAQLGPRERGIAIEAFHWCFGAAAGAAYAALPANARRVPLSGPLYGLAIWGAFELTVAPFLRVRHAERRPLASRAMVAIDHLVYGAVLDAPASRS